MTHGTALDVVNAFIDSAYVRRDYTRLRGCLDDDDFSYEDPVNRFYVADDLVQFQMLVGPIVERVEVVRQFADGDEVCTLLQVTAQLAERTSNLVVLWATVREGRIVRLVAVFDAHEYKLLYRVEDA